MDIKYTPSMEDLIDIRIEVNTVKFMGLDLSKPVSIKDLEGAGLWCIRCDDEPKVQRNTHMIVKAKVKLMHLCHALDGSRWWGSTIGDYDLVFDKNDLLAVS